MFSRLVLSDSSCVKGRFTLSDYTVRWFVFGSCFNMSMVFNGGGKNAHNNFVWWWICSRSVKVFPLLCSIYYVYVFSFNGFNAFRFYVDVMPNIIWKYVHNFLIYAKSLSSQFRLLSEPFNHKVKLCHTEPSHNLL